MHFKDIDLRRDKRAATYVKHEIVAVTFAISNGSVQSREGTNRFAQGDAIVTGSNGDIWSVSRDRFDVRYEPASTGTSGVDGPYRNKRIPVLARQIRTAFTVERRAGGDLLKGKRGDWLIQYAPGDHGIVDREKFERLYRRQTR